MSQNSDTDTILERSDEENEEDNSETTEYLAYDSKISSLQSTNQSSFNSPLVAPMLKRMTDETLLVTVEEMKSSLPRIRTENTIFSNFLERADPQWMEASKEVAHPRMSIGGERRMTVTPSQQSSVFFDFGTDVGARVNLSQKSDLIQKEMDALQENLDRYALKFNKSKFFTKVHVEELSLRENELLESISNFESLFLSEGSSISIKANYTAAKYLWFMNEWLRRAGLTIEKLRLRSSSLRVQYQKLSNKVIQKKALGENLQEVDFENLEIENKHLSDKLEKRNVLLLELKIMNGKASLMVSQQKKQLEKKQDLVQKITTDIQEAERQMIKFDEERYKVYDELEATQKVHTKLRKSLEIYQVPSIIEYVRKKTELGVLKKSIKVWSRRTHMKEVALASVVKDLKSYTGEDIPNARFLQSSHMPGSTGSFHFPFEIIEMKKKKSCRLSARNIHRRA